MTGKFRVGSAIYTARCLRLLPEGTRINDEGLSAQKVGGSWLYLDGNFWEPFLPVIITELPKDY